ncbi:hypothetical protein J6590_002037 [Homalodisca vitripennis]|nr:hypothetical protein J6590_002037 [Homalodisca vitripennis]
MSGTGLVTNHYLTPALLCKSAYQTIHYVSERSSSIHLPEVKAFPLSSSCSLTLQLLWMRACASVHVKPKFAGGPSEDVEAVATMATVYRTAGFLFLPAGLCVKDMISPYFLEKLLVATFVWAVSVYPFSECLTAWPPALLLLILDENKSDKSSVDFLLPCILFRYLIHSSIQTNYSAVDSYFKILCIPLHNSSPPPFAYGTEQNILKTCPKTEIERLTDQYFGHLYSNYHVTRPVLVRQARDLLVCSYHGNTARFEAEFCQPAAAIMAEVIQRSVIEVGHGYRVHSCNYA